MKEEEKLGRRTAVMERGTGLGVGPGRAQFQIFPKDRDRLATLLLLFQRCLDTFIKARGLELTFSWALVLKDLIGATPD